MALHRRARRDARRRDRTPHRGHRTQASAALWRRTSVAILTGNYTGGGQKDWTFYTRHLPSFGERLNECLAPYPMLPLEIHCEEDPDWSDYHEMLALEADDSDED